MEFNLSQIICEIFVYINEKINKTPNWICKLYYSFGVFWKCYQKMSMLLRSSARYFVTADIYDYNFQ